MPVLVDTNVIIDVLTDDRQWADWSIEQLEANAGSGLIINPVVYAELCFGSPSIDFVDGHREVIRPRLPGDSPKGALPGLKSIRQVQRAKGNEDISSA